MNSIKLYKKSDLNVQTYGSGKKKKFIIYTDFEETDRGPVWNTRVYPDIQGNKKNAIKQSLDWLNRENIPEPWVVRNSPRKISLTYYGMESTDRYFETDSRGEKFDF